MLLYVILFVSSIIPTDHGHEGEVKGVEWKFGCAILGGYLLPLFIAAAFPRHREHECDDNCGESPELRDANAAGRLALLDTTGRYGSVHSPNTRGAAQDADATQDKDINATQTVVSGSSEECEKDKDSSDDDTGSSKEGEVPEPAALESGEAHAHSHAHGDASAIVTKKKSRYYRDSINYPLCATILLGDSFHNFADGIFVGVGFLLCSRDVALSILFITLYHEIAQELADFFILTKHAGLTVLWALGLNFLSGLSVMLGGITVLAVKDLTSQAVGIILAIAAGVYIYIGASECTPRADKHLHGWRDRVLGIAMFSLGAIPIGLALLNHQHCDGSH